MTLSELKYVLAVARERHFGRAAETCHVSQPTLSVGVRKLEEELGVTLFERGKGEVLVTPVGEQVIDQAQRVLEGVASLRQAAESSRGELVSPLRLGAIYTIGPYLFPEIVPILKERAPRMPLLIEENFTHVLVQALKRGEIDVVLLSLPFSDPSIVTHALYDEPFVLLLPTGHPWTERERIDIRTLSDESVLLLGAGHCFRDQVLEACPECGRAQSPGDLPRTMEGSSLETIRHMVASGLGITVLPCTSAGVANYSQRLVKIRRFQSPVPKRRVALAWRRGFPRPQAVAVVRDAIRDAGLTCTEWLPDEAVSSAGVIV